MGDRPPRRADAAHARGRAAAAPGDVVAFPRGKEGAHQIRNDTDAPVRVLMLSTLIAPDIVEYLDSGKIGARSVAGERILLSRPGPTLDYWDGEDGRVRGWRYWNEGLSWPCVWATNSASWCSRLRSCSSS